MTLSKGPQTFPRAEYLRRLAAVKSEMARLDIDPLFVSNLTNITYLTGLIVRHSAPQGVVVSIHKEEPTLILKRQDAPAAIYQTFLQRGNVIAYRESLVWTPDLDGYDAVIDFLHEAGLAFAAWGSS